MGKKKGIVLTKDFEVAKREIIEIASSEAPNDAISMLLQVRKFSLDGVDPEALTTAQLEGIHRFVEHYERLFMWVFYFRFPIFKKNAYPWNTPTMRHCKPRAELFNKQLDLCRAIFELDSTIPFNSPMEWWAAQMIEEYRGTLSTFLFFEHPISKRTVATRDRAVIRGLIGKGSAADRKIKDDFIEGLLDEKKRLLKRGYNLAWQQKNRAFRIQSWNPFLSAWEEHQKFTKNTPKIQPMFLDPTKKQMRIASKGSRTGRAVASIVEKQGMRWIIGKKPPTL